MAIETSTPPQTCFFCRTKVGGKLVVWHGENRWEDGEEVEKDSIYLCSHCAISLGTRLIGDGIKASDDPEDAARKAKIWSRIPENAKRTHFANEEAWEAAIPCEKAGVCPIHHTTTCKGPCDKYNEWLEKDPKKRV